jgi:NAD(P)-dependent dehydrogenase (short-subunit alcohol dehydrogenase family)
MANQLAGKTAVITGGGTGIGRAVALSLAAAGCQVVVTGRREEPLQETAALHQGEPPILTHTVDVSRQDSVETLFNWVESKAGTVDILVCSAGTNVPKRSMAELSPEDWSRMLGINATGAFLCMRAVLPAMRTQGEGLIVNISSIAGKRSGLLGGVGYCASKFAMTALGGTAALEDGPHGIRITTIFPGEVETPILDNRPVPVSAEHRARILQPEDVAAAVVMVANLPPRAHIPELIIKPTSQEYA